mmetsp:Transcript_25433/g.58570  ORF Transcript_25433/g.58570 Transcript_25433/m.58570 type:complete len:237 (-) Transcript_25433:337-1047(-)
MVNDTRGAYGGTGVVLLPICKFLHGTDFEHCPLQRCIWQDARTLPTAHLFDRHIFLCGTFSRPHACIRTFAKDSTNDELRLSYGDNSAICHWFWWRVTHLWLASGPRGCRRRTPYSSSWRVIHPHHSKVRIPAVFHRSCSGRIPRCLCGDAAASTHLRGLRRFLPISTTARLGKVMDLHLLGRHGLQLDAARMQQCGGGSPRWTTTNTTSRRRAGCAWSSRAPRRPLSSRGCTATR